MPAPSASPDRVVLIGVSTGGPGALEQILPALPADFTWPVVVAQHMPQAFTGVFARRMASFSRIRVVEADRPMPLEPGTAYIARGDSDITLSRRCGGLICLPSPASASFLWHPSVDRLTASAMAHVPAGNLIGVLLTGMGNDGANAMASLHAKGGRTIAESEESAVVWGMPRELAARGGASLVLPLHAIAAQLVQWTR
jgi:two-component system chemotaxis response regulator CheB